MEIKTDGEPSIVEIARRVQSRRDRTTSLAQSSVGGHQEIEAVERANGTVQAQLRAYYLDVLDRLKVRVTSGTLLFPWMLRHSVWTVVRYQADQKTKQTPYKRTRGSRYESSLVPFGEVVMAKTADGDKLRAGKLDSAWVKAVWVARVDKSNDHLLLTAKSCIRSRVVRRIPDGDQACYHAEVPGLPWDTFKGSAKMLRNATTRPGELPRPSRGRPRKDGTPAQSRTATTTTEQEAAQDDQVRRSMPGSSDDHLRQLPTDEQDVIEQDMVIDTETLEVSGGKEETGEVEGSEPGVRQMEDDEMEVAVGEQRRRRRLTCTQPVQQASPEGETSRASSKRLKREATIAAVKEEILNAVREERPDLEQVHNFHASIRTTRSTDSIQASRMVEINKVEGARCHREMESGRGRGFRREKCFRLAGWTIRSRRSQGTWSRNSRTREIQRCSQQQVTQLWGEWLSARR